MKMSKEDVKRKVNEYKEKSFNDWFRVAGPIINVALESTAKHGYDKYHIKFVLHKNNMTAEATLAVYPTLIPINLLDFYEDCIRKLIPSFTEMEYNDDVATFRFKLL